MARKPGVYGAKGVSAAFREMAKIIGRPVDEASRHALRPVLAAAKRNTPHASIKKALVLKKDRKAPKTRPTHVVGGRPGDDGTPLMHLQEFGVEPHKIGSIDHPGHAAFPFLTPAFTAEGANSIKRFGEKLGPSIEKQAARLAAKHRGSK